MVMTQWSLIGLIAIRPANCAFYLDNSMRLKEGSKLKNTDKDKYYVLGEMIVSQSVQSISETKGNRNFRLEPFLTPFRSISGVSSATAWA